MGAQSLLVTYMHALFSVSKYVDMCMFSGCYTLRSFVIFLTSCSYKTHVQKGGADVASGSGGASNSEQFVDDGLIAQVLAWNKEFEFFLSSIQHCPLFAFFPPISYRSMLVMFPGPCVVLCKLWVGNFTSISVNRNHPHPFTHVAQCTIRPTYIHSPCISTRANQILKSICVASPRTLALCTGDGNANHGRCSFYETVTIALQMGWKVEVWAWKNSVSKRYALDVTLCRYNHP